MDTEIPINDGLYNSALRHYLWSNRFDHNFNKSVFEVLHRLCVADLLNENTRIAKIAFTDKEQTILHNADITHVCKNKEIVAQWCDYVQEYDKQKRPTYIKQCCTNYVEVYKATDDYEYLIRQLQLIRKAKSLFSNELDSIYAYTINEVYVCDKPLRVKQLLTELVSIFSAKKCREDFSFYLEEHVNKYTREAKYSDARLCIDALHIIGTLNNNEWHIQLAENFEKEGDHLVANKKPNTYYPNLAEVYLMGLREIKSIADCEEVKSRLEQKIRAERAEFSKMVQQFGVPATPTVDLQEIEKILADLQLNSFEKALKELINILVIPGKKIDEHISQTKRDRSPMMDLFSKAGRMDDKGAIVGSAEGGQMLINQVREYYREKTCAIIWSIKHIMDIHRMVDKGSVANLIQGSKNRFVPDDRIYIYVEGIYEGFNNNFIAAAHLLMPQLENSFRNIANQYGIETTNWAAETQHQNMFGGCLEKIKDQVDDDLYKELHSFLVDTSTTNFRNELLHGLISPVLINHYGMYLWWLTLKLVFQTEHYFCFNTAI